MEFCAGSSQQIIWRAPAERSGDGAVVLAFPNRFNAAKIQSAVVASLCRRTPKSLEFRRALFNKRRMSLFKIRMLHAQRLRDSFGFERGLESHVHFAI